MRKLSPVLLLILLSFACSSKNQQPVRFVVIQDKDHMAELKECADFGEPLIPATAAIAVCVGPESNVGDFDAGRAAQNIMVAAWNEGLASCPLRIHREDCGRTPPQSVRSASHRSSPPSEPLAG